MMSNAIVIIDAKDLLDRYVEGNYYPLCSYVSYKDLFHKLLIEDMEEEVQKISNTEAALYMKSPYLESTDFNDTTTFQDIFEDFYSIIHGVIEDLRDEINVVILDKLNLNEESIKRLSSLDRIYCTKTSAYLKFK